MGCPDDTGLHGMKKYTTEFHRNSNRSRGVRERVNADRAIRLLPPRDFEQDPLMSAQVWRSGSEDAEPLPRQHSPAVLRAWRSKYERHTGAKQLARRAS